MNGDLMIDLILGDAWKWLLGAAVIAGGLVKVWLAGAKAEKNKAVVKRLRADKATSERIDNAKPAENINDARNNLRRFLRRGK